MILVNVVSQHHMTIIRCWGKSDSDRLLFCFPITFKIIMAKPAGGPKPPSGKKDWDEDQND